MASTLLQKIKDFIRGIFYPLFELPPRKGFREETLEEMQERVWKRVNGPCLTPKECREIVQKASKVEI